MSFIFSHGPTNYISLFHEHGDIKVFITEIKTQPYCPLCKEPVTKEIMMQFELLQAKKWTHAPNHMYVWSESEYTICEVNENKRITGASQVTKKKIQALLDKYAG